MRKQSIELALVAFVFAIFAPTASVDPKPVKPNVIKCEPAVEPEPVKNAIIEFTTADFFCKPCEDFKDCIPDLKRKGWTVETTVGGAESYPRFRIWVRGKSREHVGGLSMRKLRQIVEEMTGEPQRPVAVIHDTSPVYYRDWAGPARWTWPGDLRTHLQGAPHHINTAGMRPLDLIRTHDALHESTRTATVRRTRVMRRG